MKKEFIKWNINPKKREENSKRSHINDMVRKSKLHINIP